MARTSHTATFVKMCQPCSSVDTVAVVRIAYTQYGVKFANANTNARVLSHFGFSALADDFGCGGSCTNQNHRLAQDLADAGP